MFKMKIRPILILALKSYYENFYIIVSNDKNFAAPFVTTSGVKQGGSISSELYKLYVEIIATIISAQKLGVDYGSMCIDIIMYADDIILMASTVNNMQKMLNEVTKFGQSHQIKFNPNDAND